MPPDLFCMGCRGDIFRACLRQCCIWNSIDSDEKLLDSPGIRIFHSVSRAWDLYISVHITHSACWELHSGAPTKYRSLSLPVQARPSGAVLLHWPSARSVCHFRMWFRFCHFNRNIPHISFSHHSCVRNSSTFGREEMTSCDFSLLPSDINHKG